MNRTTCFCAVIALMFLALHQAKAVEIGSWKCYLAYHDITDICRAAEGNVFVLASNDLYMYNTNDHSITTFDKTNILNDQNIKMVAWNPTAKRLIAVYANNNIDLIDCKGNSANMAEIFHSNLSSKTINSIRMNGKFAYLGGDFGIIKLNMADAEISDTYNVGQRIMDVGFQNGFIYGKISDTQVIQARTNTNLNDKSNWTVAANNVNHLFKKDTSDYDTFIEEVRTLLPGGPDSNNFGHLLMKDGKLYTTGKIPIAFDETPATVQIYDGDKWTVLDNNAINQETGHPFFNATAIDLMPGNPDIYAVTGQTGVYIFRNNTLLHHYSYDNSPLMPPVALAGLKSYVLVMGCKFLDDGSLLVVNERTLRSLLKWNMADATNSNNGWVELDDSKLMFSANSSLQGMMYMMTDSRGKVYFVNNHWNNTAVISHNPATGENLVFNNFVNQDGMSYALQAMGKICEDRNGNIWVPSDNGLFYLSADELRNGEEKPTFHQVKVPRNDGTNFADYLLAGIRLKCVTVDGANRKWVGTETNGVYLVSADNMEQLQHFTTENSPLLSNAVHDIAVNNETGEVFFATEEGLCSFTSDATMAAEEMTKGSVYAYPNPVTPDYTGSVTIMGLTFDADVIISTVSGRLVHRGRSNGGTYVWDCCDKDGRRVATGIYYVLTAKSDGTKGTVCKIAIVN